MYILVRKKADNTLLNTHTRYCTLQNSTHHFVIKSAADQIACRKRNLVN